jgi:hypothetical protein
MLVKAPGHEGGPGQLLGHETQFQQGHLCLAMLLLFGPSLPGLGLALQATQVSHRGL